MGKPGDNFSIGSAAAGIALILYAVFVKLEFAFIKWIDDQGVYATMTFILLVAAGAFVIVKELWGVYSRRKGA